MTDSLMPLDPKTTALVLIDLQRGVAAMPVQPHASADVIIRAAALAERFRALGAPVVLVHVSFSPDGRDLLTPPNDAAPPRMSFAEGWDEIVPELGPRPGDLLVTKRQWGAFYGTDLDLQLRRRGVKTIVLGGISTNIGVESTARAAFEHGYAQILVEDTMASHSAEAHAFAVTQIFPRLGHVRTADQVLAALASAE
jgi:nicotinamidase-related amidase